MIMMIIYDDHGSSDNDIYDQNSDKNWTVLTTSSSDDHDNHDNGGDYELEFALQLFMMIKTFVILRLWHRLTYESEI